MPCLGGASREGKSGRRDRELSVKAWPYQIHLFARCGKKGAEVDVFQGILRRKQRLWLPRTGHTSRRQLQGSMGMSSQLLIFSNIDVSRMAPGSAKDQPAGEGEAGQAHLQMVEEGGKSARNNTKRPAHVGALLCDQRQRRATLEKPATNGVSSRNAPLPRSFRRTLPPPQSLDGRGRGHISVSISVSPVTIYCVSSGRE